MNKIRLELSRQTARRQTAGMELCKAFTLTELLVTITIIGVLVAISLPVLNATLDKGRRADSVAKLRTIGVAFNTYLQDHNNTFPNRSGNSLPANVQAVYGNWGSWDAAISGQMAGNQGVGDRANFHSKRDARPVPSGGTANYPRSFTLNPSIINLGGNMASFGASQSANTGLLASRVTKPSSFALVYEAYNPTSTNYVGADSGQSSGDPGPPLDQGLFCVVCLDGHVDTFNAQPNWKTTSNAFWTKYFTVNQ